MYSIIDIESNGGGFRKENIIEIAIYRFDGHEITDQFISLVNPEAEITAFVQKLTGITPNMVKTAPKFHELAKRVVEITEGSTLVGHNIDFDYRMLRQSFKRLGYDYKINTLDTIPLAKKLIPDAPSYSLSKLVKSLGIPLTNAHRASGDARATLELFKLLISKDTQNEIIQKQFEESNAKTYINKIRELTQDLPNEKGIVYFQNAEGKIIFSEFADDISRFSKKLFNSKSRKVKKIQDGTEQIHYDLVGNDLLAKLILKSKGIRKSNALPFGLYFKKSKFLVEKTSYNQEEPLLKFKSYTQGLKVVNFIKSQEEFSDFDAFLNKINLKNRNEIWLMEGRVLGEKSFILIKNGKPQSYGFYEVYTQIQQKSKLEKIQIPLKKISQNLLNDLKLLLLRGGVDIQPLPH